MKALVLYEWVESSAAILHRECYRDIIISESTVVLSM